MENVISQLVRAAKRRFSLATSQESVVSVQSLGVVAVAILPNDPITHLPSALLIRSFSSSVSPQGLCLLFGKLREMVIIGLSRLPGIIILVFHVANPIIEGPRHLAGRISSTRQRKS